MWDIIKSNWTRVFIYLGLGVASIIVLVFLFHAYIQSKYDEGYATKNAQCIQEKADDNTQRQNQTVEIQKTWNKIDAKPNASSSAILKRMRNDDL